jgi:hypothetical protein
MSSPLVTVLIVDLVGFRASKAEARELEHAEEVPHLFASARYVTNKEDRNQLGCRMTWRLLHSWRIQYGAFARKATSTDAQRNCCVDVNCLREIIA